MCGCEAPEQLLCREIYGTQESGPLPLNWQLTVEF